MLAEFIVPAGSVLAIDQGIKRFVLARFGGGPFPSEIRLKPSVRVLLNRRMALGMIRNRRVLLFLWGFSLLGTILLTQYAPSFRTSTARVGLGIALGGATSNVLDWLKRGAVIDFIDLRIWPVFNVADVSIVLGIGVVLWSMQ